MNRILLGAVHGLFCLGGLFPTVAAEPSANIVLADFEGDDYGNWTAEGNGFTIGPQEPVQLYRNRQGQRLAMSRREFGGDSARGTLTSPLFQVERKYLFFWLGGGNHPDETCVQLLIDGQPVESQSGTDSKSLVPVFWDLSKYQGQTAQIRLVDDRQGKWGHIAADFFVLTDRMEEPAESERQP